MTGRVETAYAKVNLALHVRRRRDDGYHQLETLFAFAEDGDELAAEPADGLTLSISGEFGDGLPVDNDNLILSAARGLQKIAGLSFGARLHLTKNLPVAAGIGGGSADAAAAIRLLVKLWGIAPDPDQLHHLATGLGADVPACLSSQTVRGEGVGEILLPVAADELAGLPLLLVNPRLPCPTGPVFKAWDGVDRGSLAAGPPLAAAISGRNDLQPPAMALIPEIRAICEALTARPGVLLARMSGSGATCFALFENDAARDAAKETMPHFWHLATRLR